MPSSPTSFPVTLLRHTDAQLEREIAFRLRTDLDALGSSYSLRLIAPEGAVDILACNLSQRLGKRRSKLLRVEAIIHMLQRLKGDTSRLTSRIRTSVIEAIASLSTELRDMVEQTEDIDRLILDEPDSPLAIAYCSGLHALGIDHPYLCLADIELPVDLEALYITDFGALPEPVQQWLLASLSRGIRLLLSGIAESQLALLLPASAELTVFGPASARSLQIDEARLIFEQSHKEHEAIIRACAENSVDTVFCATRRSQAELEIDFLLRRIPYHAPSMSSVISSETINALVAYLEWTVYENESGLEIILNMMEITPNAYHRFSKAHRLPHPLSTACLLLPGGVDETDSVHKALSNLAELVFDSRMSSSAYGRACFFCQWGHQHIPEFDATLLQFLIDRSGLAENTISLADLKDVLYGAISDDVSHRVTITSPVSHDTHACQRAWLALGISGNQRSERLRSAVVPRVQRSLTVSSVRIGAGA